MRQLQCFGDDRNNDRCVHCGGADETDDHVPSKVLLDEPYPENLMVCPSCRACNNALSLDEEYLTCLLECVLVGTTEPSKMLRPRIGRILERNRALQARLRAGRSGEAGNFRWNVENERVRNVLLKLGRCHAAYELNEPQLQAPSHIGFKPLALMSPAERAAFEDEDDGVVAAWPEVGSRAMQRLLIVDDKVFSEGWLLVQPENYRFKVLQDGAPVVRIVLREYLGCEVAWD